MTSIALFGAGGKMGYRLSSNLRGSRYDVRHVEVSEAGRARLKDGFGYSCVAPDAAPAWEAAKTAPRSSVSANIKPKRKVAALFKAQTETVAPAL